MASIPKRRRIGQRAHVPRTLGRYNALPGRSQDAAQNAAQVITRMREGVSLTSACAEFGIDPRTVERLAGSALRQNKSGRYVAKASDNLLRKIVVPVHGGQTEVVVRGSRVASRLSARAAAQKTFLATGDNAQMRRLKRENLTDASGREIPFLTDLDELERLGAAGILQFESIYARRA